MSSTLSIKGQVTIPKNIKKVLKIEPVDIIDFVIENNEIKLNNIKQAQERLLTGSLNKYSKSGYTDEDIREITKRKVAIDTAIEDNWITSGGHHVNIC